jgi:AcrR family transcriptional regulator
MYSIPLAFLRDLPRVFLRAPLMHHVFSTPFAYNLEAESGETIKVEPSKLRIAREPPTQRRTQKERSSETQRKLIQAAIDLLHESGFSGLTIVDVARRAGLTSGAVQHHFPSRLALVRSVVEALYPMLNIRIDHVGSAGRSTVDRVNGLIDAYWSIYGEPKYLVFWELVFGTREVPEFWEYLLALQKEVVADAVADITRLFDDMAMQPSRAKQLFVFITSHLRGLSFLSLFEDKRAVATGIVLLKQLTCQLVESAQTRATGGKNRKTPPTKVSSVR